MMSAVSNPSAQIYFNKEPFCNQRCSTEFVILQSAIPLKQQVLFRVLRLVQKQKPFALNPTSIAD